MRHRLYYHLVWTTRDRAPIINAGIAAFLCRFLRAMGHAERAVVLEIGIVRTHVHLLIAAHPLTNIPRLLQRMKGGSAAIAMREGHAPRSRPLRWAAGYNIETVPATAVPRARHYLRRQPQRHITEAIDGWTQDPEPVEVIRS
jgi:REP-associated tyrosine transposase